VVALSWLPTDDLHLGALPLDTLELGEVSGLQAGSQPWDPKLLSFMRGLVQQKACYGGMQSKASGKGDPRDVRSLHLEQGDTP